MGTIVIVITLIVALLVFGIVVFFLKDELNKAIEMPEDPEDDELIKAIKVMADQEEKRRKQAEGKGILIYVRDNMTGSIHQVGTSTHDSLIIVEANEDYGPSGTLLEYYNLQNGEGSRYGTYSFCKKDGSDIDNSFGERYVHMGYTGYKNDD